MEKDGLPRKAWGHKARLKSRRYWKNYRSQEESFKDWQVVAQESAVQKTS